MESNEGLVGFCRDSFRFVLFSFAIQKENFSSIHGIKKLAADTIRYKQIKSDIIRYKPIQTDTIRYNPIQTEKKSLKDFPRMMCFSLFVVLSSGHHR